MHAGQVLLVHDVLLYTLAGRRLVCRLQPGQTEHPVGLVVGDLELDLLAARRGRLSHAACAVRGMRSGGSRRRCSRRWFWQAWVGRLVERLLWPHRSPPNRDGRMLNLLLLLSDRGRLSAGLRHSFHHSHEYASLGAVALGLHRDQTDQQLDCTVGLDDVVTGLLPEGGEGVEAL